MVLSFFRKLLDSILGTGAPTKYPDNSNYPPYIEYPNDVDIPLPGLLQNGMLYCFPVQGNYQKLLAVCNQRLNSSLQNQSLRYFPLTSHMMLVVSLLPDSYSLNPNYHKPGSVIEKGVQIFMPLAECSRNAQGQWVAQRIVCLVPYIMVDNQFSIVAGREQFGFPKAMGQFQIPDSPESAELFSVEAYGFSVFDQKNMQTAAFRPWLNIKKVSASENFQTGQWTSSDHAWGDIKHTFERIPTDKPFVEGLPFIIHELEDMLKAEVRLVFLKQFRDAADPMKACYQAIVEDDGFVHKFHKGWFLGGAYEVSFEDFASFPIKSELGLPDKMVVQTPFWVNVDLLFQTGREVVKTSP
jgi:hypothetical protein